MPVSKPLQRYLVRIKPLDRAGGDLLQATRLLAASLGIRARNAKRTSYGALEIDLFAESKSDIALFLAAIEPLGVAEFVNDLNAPPRHRSIREAVEEARALFNSERYWEGHEVLEGVWRTTTGVDKKYVQGVILVCAAFVHHQKGEDGVAIGVLKRAMSQLSYSEPLFFGLDVGRFRDEVTRTIDTGVFVPFRI